ncbi:uncharacterized protein LY89DRAFT_313984 [Mollisia scopiformis]|uniref:DH domain-containing protein n=1 Tax=Mollisia scopiformis TaxID=149040 RepID=A0A194XS94_MOLSC|nr:uncharacterized protein LY89DRAFT_313984 [Mollisia scopiformis]KUJ22914.1 hypothetical protein LY89DRAFT_313984 [Mollisia scopiformis]
MDGGINADQNFYSRRPNSSSPEHQQPHRYEPPPLPDFEARTPQLPPKLPFLTSQNLQAIERNTNGYAGAGALSNGGEHDPDDFYRDYRGVQQASHNYSDNSASGMAATASESRPLQSSLRSNGNGTTPKHPSLAQARNQLKPSSYRSASSPLEDRPGLNNAKSTPALNGYSRQPSVSVKAISKQFEKNTESSTSVARKPSPRINTSATAPAYLRDRGGYQARNANTPTPSTSRAGTATREAGKQKSPVSTRPTQRTRFAAEDQHSNNTLSGTARISRPRNGASGINPQASKSMSNLSPTSPTSPQTQTSRPLFGEVVPNEQGISSIGYGIPHAATRRTSDSSLHPSWQQHSRSKSNDISPTSPDAWYKGETDLDHVDPNKPRPRSHNRNHSDFPDSKVNTMNGVTPSFQTSNPPASVQAPTRLPGPSKRQSTSSTSSIPSTRSNSPFTSNRITNSKLRKPEQRPWSPAARANTPTSRAKTPTTRHSPRGKGRDPEKSTSNNASLKAYISAPPPKTSPPLRSSRPRQPVSSATTATPRQKAVDRSGSPQHVRTGMKVTRNNGEGFTARERERKISDVPLTAVDFAARRQLIQRAYTKSIHESEQKEIRAANLRRLSERQARASLAAQESEKASHNVEKDEEPVLAEAQPILEAPAETKPSPKPLQISTSFPRPEVPPATAHRAEIDQDSPTLGMPGSFVEDEEPASAISCATGITEFDNEPQTEAPRLSLLPSRPDGFSGHISYTEDLMSPEQAYFGMQNMSSPDNESIRIMLDGTPVEEHQPESTPTNDVFARDPSPPGAYQQSPEVAEELPIFASTVTTASPKQTTPVHSRPQSPLGSCDEQISNDESPILPNETVLPQHVEHDVQIHVAPEISFPDEVNYVEPQEHATRLELPTLRTALAPSVMINRLSQEFLNTPVTDIDYESSDGLAQISGGEGDLYDREYMDRPRDDEDSGRNFRSSHQSAWTDYSVGTNDEYSEREGYSRPVTTYETEDKPVPPPKELSSVVPPKPEGYSPLPSPRFPPQSSQLSIRHQLPPLTTGEGLGLGFSDSSHDFGSSTSIPLWPEYSPPPVPLADDASPAPPSRTPPPPTTTSSMRPASSLYQSSQNDNGRYTESRRASDDLYSPRASLSTPRSSTQISFDDATIESSSKSTAVPEPSLETEEEKKAAEKTRKRLYQRKMVIKELIETESVYLKDMNVVEEIYKGTAEACPKLDHSDVKTIFRNTADIIAFSAKFLDELKSAASSIYSPRSRARQSKAVAPSGSSTSPTVSDRFSIAATLTDESDDEKDRKTFIGATFSKHLKKMQAIYTDYLKHSEIASSRLATLQQDAAVQVWLSECNLVAKDLTKAWDLDALLVKPVQRITRYQLLLKELAESTPEDHPDYEALKSAREELLILLQGIDEMKKRLHVVSQIVGRKRKESDVRTNLAKAFGRRAEKLQSNANRPPEDEAYQALHNTFGVEFLRLQVVLRDVEDYARHQKEYVAKTLQYFSSMELIMRMSASKYPEIESKWVRFNLSMRDMGTIAIDDHIGAIQREVVEPLEKVIQMYNKPGDAMQKRNKRRLDYEKSLSYKSQGKKIDEKLAAQVAQYEALNETLKIELPKLSALTKSLGRLCQIRLLFLKTEWYGIWQKKLSGVLEASQIPKDNNDILEMFHRDFKYTEVKLKELGINNGSFGNGGVTRGSQSTQDDESRRARPSNLSNRSRGLSINSDKSPSLPTPEFAKRNSGQFSFSPLMSNGPGLPQFAYQNMPYSNGHSRAGSGSPATPDTASSSRPHHGTMVRPGTSRSHTSDTGMARGNSDYNTPHRRESGSTYNSHWEPPSSRPYSGLFHSAMPMPDGPEESQRSSRASSRDRNISGGYNVLYLAASLFEFNISATKSEAGYPYLTYQAGEIFDVIGEKGELWLAKNQDDPSDEVGWIWSKHFARLAAD